MAKPTGKLIRTINFWQAVGCSYKGNTCRREGKLVSCGHRHRTREVAERCATKMQQTRPGRCQTYRPIQLLIEFYRKPSF